MGDRYINARLPVFFFQKRTICFFTIKKHLSGLWWAIGYTGLVNIRRVQLSDTGNWWTGFCLPGFLRSLFSARLCRNAVIYLIEYQETLSYLLVAVATLGRVWCGIYIFGHKNKVLCRDGPYSICRNPLYVFSFLGAMGVAIASNRILLIIGFTSISCCYYFQVVKFEEKRLAQLFGREYETYCSSVSRFRPNFRNYWSRKKLEVDPQLIFHAIVKNMWFFWLLFALEIIKALKRFPD